VDYWRDVVLYNFPSDGSGGDPSAALVFGPKGALYGVGYGGAYNNGIIFSLARSAPGSTVWDETSLYSFVGSMAGSSPAGSLAVGTSGTLYGTLSIGGAFGVGGVFKLAPPSAPGGSWTETLLYSFSQANGDGGSPDAGVTIGANGVLYGTTKYGGQTISPRCVKGCGTVFALGPPAAPGGAWTETILHAFAGSDFADGSQPNSTLVPGPNGVLYGTTRVGGSSIYGTIFEMVPPAAPGGAWTEVVLYSFTGGADGSSPNAVTLGANGALYGTTLAGGASNQGTVFEFVP
jgi:uncharacterized repeat protein (TIGR03803 family)